MNTTTFVNKVKLLHPTLDFSKTIYVNSKTKIKLNCPIHGEVEKNPRGVLQGQGCPECGKEQSRLNRVKKRGGKTIFIQKAKKVHGEKYDYSLVDYKNSKTKVKIICPEHGVFEQSPNSHLQGSGCNECALNKKPQNKKMTTNEFIKKSKEVWYDVFGYSKVKYKSYSKEVTLLCKKHNKIFQQKPINHLQGFHACPSCSTAGTSKTEQELFKFVSSLVECVPNNREELEGQELDIFIPSKRIAIEFNGVYWHSSKFKDKKYHLEKLEFCESKDIKLIQIFEDEWVNKQEIVKSRLKNILGLSENKIYARQTEIREVETKLAMKFLKTNHLQGKVGGKIKLGLFHKDELVSLMTFGGYRKNLGRTPQDGHFELLRFCNKLNTNVVGGASKLFKYFTMNYLPKEIISYADRRWGDGNLYHHLGFSFQENTSPSYFYVIENQRKNRFQFRKSELIKQGFDKSKTEVQIMNQQGFYQIFDCGTKKYIYK